MFKTNLVIKSNWYLLLFLFPLFAAVYLFLKIDVIALSDFWGFTERASKLSLNNKYTWVNGFYPVGYPILLRLLGEIIQSYYWAGKLISIISGISILICFYNICNIYWNKINKSLWPVIVILFIACNSVFLFWVTVENTDVIWIALILFFVLKLIQFDKEPSHQNIILASVFFGLAYLTRYTALIFLPVTLYWLIHWVSYKNIWEGCKYIFLFLGIFLLVVSPQLIMSYKLTGNVLYNLQYWNVWFGIYGNFDWGKNWNTGGNFHSISEVFCINPDRFVGNFIKNIESLYHNNIYNIPIIRFTYIGIIISIFSIQQRKIAILLAGVYVSFLLAMSLAFFTDRILLLMLPFSFFYFVLPFKYFYDLVKNRSFIPSVGKKVALITIMIFTIAYDYEKIAKLLSNPAEKALNAHYIDVISEKLDLNGFQKREQVVSLSHAIFYKKGTKLPMYFTLGNTFFHPEKIHSMNDVVSYMAERGVLFLILDRNYQSSSSWFDFYWKSKPMPKYYDILFDDGLILILKIKLDYIKGKKMAKMEDFISFLSTKPQGLDENFFANDIPTRDFMFNMLQENANGDEHLWYKDNVLPFWKEYKRLRHLF